jgi:dTMP kinase
VTRKGSSIPMTSLTLPSSLPRHSSLVTRHPGRGVFITLEGPEGGGKSTLAPRLAEQLRSRGFDVVTCAEPGGGPIPQAIRSLLLDVKHAEMTPRTELMLFLAARAQQVQDTILPSLEGGRLVVSDRYSDSTMAYQAHAGGLPIEEVERIVDFATGGLWPDLTLLLDVPAEIGLARQAERNRMENKGIAFHRRVRDGFLAQAERHPGRIQVVDATRDLSEVQADVCRRVEAFLQ